MLYTMKIQLLTDQGQHDQLMEVMRRFNEVCNHISAVGFRTNTFRNKQKLSKQCYHEVREKFNFPSQLVVRAIGKVVEAYKNGSRVPLTFGDTTAVVYDSRLLTFKWMQRVSITSIGGRMEMPFRVTGYRQGTYDRRVNGLADLILQEGEFNLLLQVDLPEMLSVSALEFEEVAT